MSQVKSERNKANRLRVERKHKEWISLSVLVILALFGCLIVFQNTRQGPGLTGDSIVYIQGAKNLLTGNGYATLLGLGEIQKITGFPPMTSVVLAATNLGLGNMVTSGRWLNIVLLALNAILAGWMVFRYSHSLVATTFAGALIVTQQAVIQAHTFVMSEGLFITFMLLTLWTLAEFLEKDRQWLLVASGLLASLSILTRYIGIVLVPIAGFGLLLFGEKRFRTRLRDILVFCAASLVPLAVWFLRNQLAVDNVVDRQIGMYLMSQDKQGELIDQVLAWFYLTKLGLPWRVRVLGFIFLFLVCMSWFAWKDKWFLRRRDAGVQSLRALPYMLAVFLPLYMLAIWANSSFLDPSTSFGAIKRYLTPGFVSTAILVVCVAWRFTAGARRGILASAVSVLIGFGLIGYYATETVAYLTRDGGELGYGYTDNINFWPEEIAALKALSTSRPIVTNDSQLLYALSERYSYPFPLTGSDDGSTIVDTDALNVWLAEGHYLVIIVRYGETLADIINETLLAGYDESTQVGHLIIYSDPAYTP